MANDLVASRFGSLDAVQKYANALAGVSLLVGADNDRDILNVQPDEGYWCFGQDKTELHETDLVALNPSSFRHGYIAFSGKDVAFDLDGNPAEVLLSVTQPLPYVEDLPELEPIKGRRGEKDRPPSWQLQIAVDMVVIEGPNKGAELVYKPTSRGGLKMLRKLTEEVARKLASGDATVVPVLELFTDSYNNKTYNKRVYTPEFAIVEWVGLDETEFKAEKADSKRGKGKTEPEKHPKRGERTAKGAPVDSRRAVRDEPVGDEGDEDDDPAPRSRGRAARDEEPAPRGRRGRAPVEDEEPRTRSRRGRDEEEVEEPAPRGRRGREPVEDETEAEEPRTARSRRGREDEETSDTPVRGRRAAAGGRRR